MSFRFDFSQLLQLKPTTIAITVVGGTAACIAFIYIKNALDNQPPKKWRKVGEISDLLCFPIKSCGAIRLNEFGCSQIGLKNDYLRDRTFMVVTTDGEFITGRAYPKLTQVMPVFEGDQMTLSAPGMINFMVDIARLLTLEPIKASVWSQTVDAVDAGEEAARWFSRFILQDDFGLRLVFYPSSLPTREVREKNKIFQTAIPDDTGALHDATSFTMINEGSVTELNSRIKNPVTPSQFRPNFVVKRPAAFEEDKWKWVKIGNDVVFRNVKPCTRCLFINIDPESGERSPEQEPLKTLKAYRLFKKTGDTPVMGIHLGLRESGKVRLGDAVYVEQS